MTRRILQFMLLINIWSGKGWAGIDTMQDGQCGAVVTDSYQWFETFAVHYVCKSGTIL